MENIAIKNGLKYFCHTADDFNGFIIEDITSKCISYSDFMCNRSLYHTTIKDCLNHIRECEDVFLTYNPYTGECYRPIDWAKYYAIIDNYNM